MRKEKSMLKKKKHNGFSLFYFSISFLLVNMIVVGGYFSYLRMELRNNLALFNELSDMEFAPLNFIDLNKKVWYRSYVEIKNIKNMDLNAKMSVDMSVNRDEDIPVVVIRLIVRKDMQRDILFKSKHKRFFDNIGEYNLDINNKMIDQEVARMEDDYKKYVLSTFKNILGETVYKYNDLNEGKIEFKFLNEVN